MIRRSLTLSTLSLFLVTACGGGGATRTAPPSGPATGGTAAAEPTSGTDPATPAAPPAAVGHPRTDLIPRAVLFGNPERGAPALSPDGRWSRTPRPSTA
jgi:hypothetical protein